MVRSLNRELLSLPLVTTAYSLLASYAFVTLIHGCDKFGWVVNNIFFCGVTNSEHTCNMKWSDLKWSMVTHTRNLCSAFDPSKVHTHISEHTHTPWTHTQSSGQPFILRCPGSSWGFGALLKGTSVVVLKVERALYIHSPHLQFLPARDSNSQPFDYESDSLTIRPRLPPYIPLILTLHFNNSKTALWMPYYFWNVWTL